VSNPKGKESEMAQAKKTATKTASEASTWNGKPGNYTKLGVLAQALCGRRLVVRDAEAAASFASQTARQYEDDMLHAIRADAA